MIDFDEIESEEKVVFAKQKVEEEQRQQEEEEKRKKDEAARFKHDLFLEQEIERRCQITEAERAEEGDGILGVRLTSSAGANIAEAINESLLTIGRHFAKHRSEHSSWEFFHRGAAAIVAFLNALMQCRFHEGVVHHFEQLVALFAKPKSGLCAALLLIVSTPPEVKDANQWQKASAALAPVLACLRRTICWVTTRRRQAKEALTSSLDILGKYFRDLAGPIAEPEWPETDAAEAVEVVLRFPPPIEQDVSVKVRAGLSVEELKRILVECLGLPPALRLSTQGRGKLEALHPATKMRTIKLPIQILDDTPPDHGPSAEQGSDRAGESEKAGDEEDDEEEEGKQDGRMRDCVLEHAGNVFKILSGQWLPNDWSTVVGSGWVSRWHVVRTTPVAMTRLLHELRTRFQAVEFQETYKELKMRMRHIDCALKVQQSVLPSYGFAETLAGVNDMRAETMHHEVHGPDGAVMKLRLEIHGLLEYGEPPRKMPVTRAITPERIPVQQTQRWMQHLADEGFAVIAGVASQSEVERAYTLLWDFIESSDVTGRIRRRDSTTWFDAMGNDRGWPGERDDGIIHTRGIGQSEVLWYLRNLPALRGVFASIWGTEDLVCSFDGAGVFRPYGQFESWRTTKKNWFHVDQTHKRRGLHCVQGLLNMKNASRETGGLVVVPRSHRFFGDVLRRYDEPRSQDSLHLDVTDPVLTEGDTGPRLVCAEAGDLIVWDSRTVHCNTPPLVDDATLLNAGDLIRAVAYICMTPASWCTKEVVDRRLLAAQAGITTTHVPHAYRPMDIPDRFPALQLSQGQRQLVGGLGSMGDGKQKGEAAKQPGRVSFMPEKKFQVAGGNVQVRGSATLEWGSAQGTIAAGAVVAGFAFGDWLRLASWPDALFIPAQDGKTGEHDELWVPTRWAQGHLEPLYGLVPLPTA